MTTTTQITLPDGTEPVPTDGVLMSQNGTTTAATFSQFLSGLPNVSGVDASQLLITPTGSTTSTTLADFAADTLPLSGGTMTGPLTLAADPTSGLQAATKEYVDSSPGNTTGVINVKSPPYNAKIDGSTDDTAAFAAAYAAAPAYSVIYVPFGVTVLQSIDSWGIPLTNPVKWIVDGTTLPDGTSLADAIPNGDSEASFVLPGLVVGNTAGNSGLSTEASQGASQPTDFAVSRSAYIVNHSGGTAGTVATNSRIDTIVGNSPENDIWGGLDRLLWIGTSTGSTPAQHVARYMQTVRQQPTTETTSPQPQMWAAAMEYRDTTGQPSSVTGAAITCEMDWFGNGADDNAYGNIRQIQSLVIGQNDTSGETCEVSNIIGVYVDGGSTAYTKTVLLVAVPFATSVIDTTNATQMSGAAAIRLGAGHSVAFEPTASYYLSFDTDTNVLRWHQNTLSYVVGKGITVGFQNVATSNTTLPDYVAGNIVFLAGTKTFTVTLPAAATVAAGTGFTFSVISTATVSIAPGGSDSIDNGPVTLRQNDRYHIISDGNSSWHEVFRTNSVNPHFTGTPVLPSYTVAGLPSATIAGAKAFTSNGRKPGESAGAGTGVEVFCDGTSWISVCSGSPVQA